MSRMAQEVTRLTDELRARSRATRESTPKGKKKGTAMDDTTTSTQTTDEAITNTEAAAAADIEPDDAPAGDDAMKTDAKKVAKAKRVRTAAKKGSDRSARKAAASAPKTAKSGKGGKKAAKAAKAAASSNGNKPIVGGLPPLGELKRPTSIEGGERNQFVNITFPNGHAFKLWPSGYGDAKDRIKARDLMVAWLNERVG
jgi:hypothetical protein